MTNEQILKKAIEKAVENGWDWKQWDFAIKRDGSCCDTAWLPAIVFSHNFAKAFWGDGKRNKEYIDFTTKKPVYSYQISGNNYSYLKRWQHHLQKMVLSKEPLKYLEKFLEEQ